MTIENLEIIDCQASSIVMETDQFHLSIHTGSSEEDTYDDYDHHHDHDHEEHGGHYHEEHGENQDHYHVLMLVVLKNLVFKNNVNLDMFGVGGAVIINDGFEVTLNSN